MKQLYDKEDIKNYKTDEIPLGTTVIIKTKWDTFKGKLTLNNKDCIAIDYPKELKGTYISREGIESIRVVGNFSDLMNLIIKKDGVKNMSKKEQLLNELEQIKKEFKEKIENVQKQIEEEDNKKEYWTPNNGDKYYFVASDGGVSISAYTDLSDIRKLDFLNCFKTKEEAERQSFEELLHKKLKKFAYENNEEEIDWNNEKQFKWCIVYQHENNCANSLMIDYCMTSKDFGQIYFTSKEIVEKAIKEFRDDLMKYFTSKR